MYMYIGICVYVSSTLIQIQMNTVSADACWRMLGYAAVCVYVSSTHTPHTRFRAMEQFSFRANKQ